MPTINAKDLPEFETVRLVDLTEDSINHIAEAIVSKLNKSERHGHWIDVNGDGSLWRCSVCGELQCCESNYCGDCGAKMDEEKENE